MLAGYVPPSARSEEIGQMITPSKHLHCEEVKIEAERNAVLHGLLMRKAAVETRTVNSVVVYFQGMML